MRRRATPELTWLDPPTRIPDDLRRLIRARRTALAAIGPTTQPQHPVILSGQVLGKDGILVYLLSGSPRDDIAVLGKHHRVLVSPNGKIGVSVEPLSSTMAEVPLWMLPTTVPGGDPWIMHWATASPLETHVFVSLWYRTPVQVGTHRGNWMVDGARISLLPVPKSPKPRPLPGESLDPAGSSPQRAGTATAIEPVPGFLSRKPWWRFW
jgi:hypothetical protein